METKYPSILAISLLLLSATVAASMVIPANENAKERAQAPENSPVIGDDWDIERVDFVHYVKPENPAKPPKTDVCYKLMGVKWSTLPVNYYVNPTNPYGLSSEFVTSTISLSAETWDVSTSKDLFNNAYAVDSSAQYGIYDGKNAIVFADYNSNTAIAVTSVWYSKRTKQILEFDQIYNTRFVWGDATIDPGVMDLQNIATHELGHAVGLDDLYTSSCTAVTMYGYSTEGELSKRTLEQPDIAGLQKMYGV